MTIQCCQVDLHVGPQFKEENRVEEGGEGATTGPEMVSLEVDDCDGDEEEAGDVDDLQQEAEALSDPLLKGIVSTSQKNRLFESDGLLCCITQAMSFSKNSVRTTMKCMSGTERRGVPSSRGCQ